MCGVKEEEEGREKRQILKWKGGEEDEKKEWRRIGRLDRLVRNGEKSISFFPPPSLSLSLSFFPEAKGLS